MTEKLTTSNPQIFYAVPLRDAVIFPQMTTTILVGRSQSIKSIQSAKEAKMPVFVIAQIKPDTEEFVSKNVYNVGTLCNIVETIKTVDGTLKVVVRALTRGKLIKVIPSEGFFACEVKLLARNQSSLDEKEIASLTKGCLEGFVKFAEYNKRITPQILEQVTKSSSTSEIVYTILSFLSSSLEVKQEILEEDDVGKNLGKVYELLQLELNISQTEEKINKQIQEKISKSQKELYLNEQLKYIKKELGHEEEDEVEQLKKKIKKLKLSKEVADKCQSELSKLEKTNLFSSEAGVIRSYLEWIVSLPWSKNTKSNKNLKKAKEILDKNHYALKKIKDRILEFIAVQIRTNEVKGPILCLVGAPGVGKTSLARSIASAVGRKYVKVSLGGVKDESEIRGHRRTYIGSLPGRIVQSMKKAKYSNPLMLLDEIDKMSSDMRGDPASALLEVLDPEQNKHFSDHYLEVEYDLSKVMFVATANNISGIPIPLRDRMEIIRLAGYTESEKLEIAKKHLVPRQRKDHGLKASELKISDDALLALIRRYTFEAGVRGLDKEIANIARKTVKEIIESESTKSTITDKNLKKYSGPAKFNYGVIKEEHKVGVATGLAYTDFGGDLLDIEAVKFVGSGKIQITGKLGDVMKESAQAALSYVRSIAKELKVSGKEFNKYDFHIHVPEGATPKDGPSAGVALCLSLASCISGFAVNKDVAVTGEITLTGKVLEIGGLKEKLLAALRGKIKTVLIPKQNEKDLEELPEEIKDKLVIKTISTVKEAFKEALVGYEGSGSNKGNSKQKKSKNKEIASIDTKIEKQDDCYPVAELSK